MELDGTLIDSVPDACASLNRVLASEDWGPLHPDQVSQMIGHGARILIEQVVSQSGKIEAVSIDALGLRDKFPAIVCGDTLPHSKARRSTRSQGYRYVGS